MLQQLLRVQRHSHLRASARAFCRSRGLLRCSNCSSRHSHHLDNLANRGPLQFYYLMFFSILQFPFKVHIALETRSCSGEILHALCLTSSVWCFTAVIFGLFIHAYISRQVPRIYTDRTGCVYEEAWKRDTMRTVSVVCLMFRRLDRPRGDAGIVFFCVVRRHL